MTDNGKPKYFSLMEQLRSDIVSGVIRPGEKLPSENELSHQYCLLIHTVRKALGILEQDGYVEAFHGRGTYCSENMRHIKNSKNIAVVTTYISDYIFPRLIQGMDNVLSESGYSIILKNTANSRQKEARCLEELLKNTPVSGQRFIVTDGVFSMDGDIAPVPDLIRLKEKYNACLIVDDAHGVGVIGETGRGSAEHFHVSGIDIQVGTLSKALGAEGGYAAASREICDYLRNVSRPFIFSTSISAVTGMTALAALRLLEREPERFVGRLMENTRYMKEKLAEAGIPVEPSDTPIIPIILSEEEKTLAYASRCIEEGILLSAIRPPTVPAGTSRIRLTVTAAHTKEELDRAVAVMKAHFPLP